MALIKCPECGKEISDKAQACPYCGCPISVATQENESKLIVYGMKEFGLGGDIKLYLDKDYVATVNHYGQVEIKIDKDCELTAKIGFNKSKQPFSVKAGKVTQIQIEWNRISGRLSFIEVSDKVLSSK